MLWGLIVGAPLVYAVFFVWSVVLLRRYWSTLRRFYLKLYIVLTTIFSPWLSVLVMLVLQNTIDP